MTTIAIDRKVVEWAIFKLEQHGSIAGENAARLHADLRAALDAPQPERSTRHLLTPEMLEVENAAGGVFAAGALYQLPKEGETK